VANRRVHARHGARAGRAEALNRDLF
jgi:hypothetical protein